DENCPEIIKRSDWTDIEPRSVNYFIIPIPYVIIHHTVTPECDSRSTCAAAVESIRYFHMDVNKFLIGGDGNIYEGCGWNREGAHTYGYNKKSIAIAFIGNFEEKAASDEMVNAAYKLILCGKSQGILRENVRVIGAKQVRNVLSPGVQLQNQIKNWPEWVATP
ncbi:Peptidoglycan-recognition protein SA, partial [Melipona quadrifasciata]